MAQTRSIRKKNIINWSLYELGKLATEAKDTPPEITNTIAKLKAFREKAKWVDFQTNPESPQWKHDSEFITKMRNELISTSVSFMRKEENQKENDNNYNKNFYDVIEAMLLGFAEQWPKNDIKKENITETYAPNCCICLLSLTGMENKASDNKSQNFTISTLEGRQFDKECLSSSLSTSNLRQADPISRLNYLPRDYRNFKNNGINLTASSPDPEQKHFIEVNKAIMGLLGFLITVFLSLTCTYIIFPFICSTLPSNLIGGFLLFLAEMIAILITEIKVVEWGLQVGEAIGAKRANDLILSSILPEPNSKVAELFKALVDNPNKLIYEAEANQPSTHSLHTEQKQTIGAPVSLSTSASVTILLPPTDTTTISDDTKENKSDRQSTRKALDDNPNKLIYEAETNQPSTNSLHAEQKQMTGAPVSLSTSTSITKSLPPVNAPATSSPINELKSSGQSSKSDTNKRQGWLNRIESNLKMQKPSTVNNTTANNPSSSSSRPLSPTSR